jgi:hypothetical protein
VMSGEGVVLLYLFLKEIYVFVTQYKPLLDVSGIWLTAKDGYNSNVSGT